MLCELYFKKKLIVRDKKRNSREEILGYVWQFSSMRESLAPLVDFIVHLPIFMKDSIMLRFVGCGNILEESAFHVWLNDGFYLIKKEKGILNKK